MRLQTTNRPLSLIASPVFVSSSQYVLFCCRLISSADHGTTQISRRSASLPAYARHDLRGYIQRLSLYDICYPFRTFLIHFGHCAGVDVLFWGQTIQSFEESCEVRRLLKTQVNRRRFGELPAGNLFGCCTCPCCVQPSFRRASEQQEKVPL